MKHTPTSDIDGMATVIPCLLEVEPKTTGELILQCRKLGLETAMIHTALRRIKAMGVVDQDESGLWRLA